jgi:hypothetical protein
MHAEGNGLYGLCGGAVELKQMQVYHTKPLVEGGTNEKIDMQVICKIYHFQQTRGEEVNGYVRVRYVASPFHIKATDIVNS